MFQRPVQTDHYRLPLGIAIPGSQTFLSILNPGIWRLIKILLNKWNVHFLVLVYRCIMSACVIQDVVFRLWMLYLGKCGIAFVKPDEAAVSSAGLQLYKRKTRFVPLAIF